ncbi:unnamed protein product [Phyllotreta striolata]|uniref:Uncharacterized protein n=1 Tax=Phyllotreta striolata TaxID=444603 RepID=A0A9N9XMV1_PHYSR|nr:unnamed protein product [Phyllotreta striolata]
MASCQKDLSRSRVRRRVVFTKSSKYFYRFNGKLNTLPYNQIVAFGYTVRVNFDLPHDAKSRYLFFKRDIHEEISNMPDELAVQGFSCAMKHICMTFSNFQFSDSCGFFCDLGKIIMRENGTEAQFIRNFFSRCDHYMIACQHEIDETTTITY